MGALVNYGSYEEEAAEQEKEDLASSGAEFMKLKVGRNTVRVLPPPPGKRSPFRQVYQHFIEMPGGAKSVICARLEAKKPCAVCQQVDKLRQSKLDVDQKAANDLYARRRVFANVIDRSAPDAGPKVLGFGKQVHEQLVALRTDPDAGGDYCHPEHGFDIIIERTGTGKNDTKYTVFPSRKQSPLAKTVDKMQEWIDTQSNLDAFAKLPPIEEVRALLAGDEAAEEEEEEEKPRRPAPKAAAKAAPAAAGKKRRTAEDDVIDVEAEEVDEDDDEDDDD